MPMTPTGGRARVGVALLLLLPALLLGTAKAQQLMNPVPYGGDWEGYNKLADGQRYSPLDQVNVSNAAQLGEVCRVRLAAHGSFEAAPVVVGDSMYVTTPTETFALDPVNCKIKWRDTYTRGQEPMLQVNRGVAYFDGKVFRGTDDGRLIAIDAQTGRELWVDVVGDSSLGENISAAPLAWNGLIIVGMAGAEFGLRGRILAFDARDGREIWRFNTVPVGAEFGANTWGDSMWAQHGGGGTWSTITLDPVTAEIFVPVGNPVPDFLPDDRKGTNLFTNSAVVLDARTGKLRWWYQLMAVDSHDYDLAAAPVLFHNKQHEGMMALAGKDGLLHVVSRTTHKELFHVPVTTVDDPPKPLTTQPTRVCPGASGGVLYNGPAFDPKRQMMFVGALDFCMIIAAQPGLKYAPRANNMGGSYTHTNDVPSGWITAVDANTGKVRWKYHVDSSMLGAVTTTAGGVVLTGDGAGNFLVFNSDTGALLLKNPTGGAVGGGVITYERGGRQYVAVTSGNLSYAQVGVTGPPTLVLYALPDSVAQSANATTAGLTRGKALYGQICTACHGPEGDRVPGKDLKTVHTRKTPAELEAFIRNPTGGMPRAFAEPLSQEDQRDVHDIVNYLSKWEN
jgi:alcohol dehydrogenase (cytochrome c)